MPSPIFPTPFGDTPWVMRKAIDRLIGAVNTNSNSIGLLQGQVTNASTSGEWLNVTSSPYNAIGDGATDNTAALQAAINTGLNLYFPEGNFLSGPLTISPYQRFNGHGRDTSIITAIGTSPIFTYKSGTSGSGDVNASLTFTNLGLYGKNIIELNDTTASPWDNQRAILGPVFRQCTLFGTYMNGVVDPDHGTDEPVTLGALIDFGCGIKASKIYDARIESCMIRNFGIGVYLDACDINVIDNCRIDACARWVHLEKHNGLGSQNTIQNCDLLLNYRIGGIYEHKTSWNTIDNNYFETNYDSSQYWINVQGEGTIFENNRIDAPVGTTPIFSIDTEGIGVLLTGNRGARNRTYEVLHNYWLGYNEQQTLVTSVDNMVSFPEVLYPQCFYDQRTSRRVWGPYSPKRMLGNIVASGWPWGTTSGIPGITTGGSAEQLIILMDTESTDESLEVSITGEMLTPPGGFITIQWGSTVVWLGDWFTSTGLQTVARQIARPPGELQNAGLRITLAPNQGYLCGIELTPSPLNVEAKTLTVSDTTELNGVTSIQAAAASGSPLAYFPGWQADPTSTPEPIKYRNRANFINDIGDGTSTGNAGLVFKNNATVDTFSFTGVTSMQAAAAGTPATYFPVFITNPASGTVAIKSRTAAQVFSDIGAAAGTGTVTHTGTLTSGTIPMGNGGVDITDSSLTYSAGVFKFGDTGNWKEIQFGQSNAQSWVLRYSNGDTYSSLFAPPSSYTNDWTVLVPDHGGKMVIDDDSVSGNGAAVSGLLVGLGGVAGDGTAISALACGIATLSGGTVTVTDTTIKAGAVILVTPRDASNAGLMSVGTITPSTSFVINSSNAGDSGDVHWIRINLQ
jgi:Pectate lyase superfamily protein/Right handed beta helix region